MSTRDRTSELAASGVAFELERFEWAEDGRLELVGSWSGLRGHRFLRPTLDVVVDGERRRMLADLEHKPWAAEEGGQWTAAFAWRGEPAKFEEAELTVSPDLAVALPDPGGAGRPAKGGSAKGGSAKASGAAVERRPARRPRSAVLEAELSAALAESAELREQLRSEQTNVRGLEAQLAQAREEAAAAQAERDEARTEADEARSAADRARADAEKARARAEAERERADAERERAEDESTRAEAERAKTENAQPEAKKLRAELAELTRERDAALERLADADRERRALAEARDRARDERNAWMQRARAVAAGRPSAARAAAEAQAASEKPAAAPAATPAPAHAEVSQPLVDKVPEPPDPERVADRRTIQIGERPGPLPPRPAAPVQAPGRRLFLDRWGPRLLAGLLVTLAVVVVLLVLFAL